MKTVSVAAFKQSLSRYLHMVVEGQELVVTSHQRPVARVIPEPSALEIRPPLKPMSSIRAIGGVALPSASLGLQMLMEDRRRR